MPVTPLGSVTALRLQQESNPLIPIVRILFGIVMEVNDVCSANI